MSSLSIPIVLVGGFYPCMCVPTIQKPPPHVAKKIRLQQAAVHTQHLRGRGRR